MEVELCEKKGGRKRNEVEKKNCEIKIAEVRKTEGKE